MSLLIILINYVPYINILILKYDTNNNNVHFYTIDNNYNNIGYQNNIVFGNQLHQIDLNYLT